MMGSAASVFTLINVADFGKGGRDFFTLPKRTGLVFAPFGRVAAIFHFRLGGQRRQ